MLSMALLTITVASCQIESPAILIYPDPVFDKNGLYRINTISIYDEEETIISVSRTYGLSKEMDLTVGIDPSVLEEYNKLNGTDYELMPEQYYTAPEFVKFEPHAKTSELRISISPKALSDALGIEKANKYAIPVSIIDSSIEIEAKGSSSEVILIPEIVNPSLTVEIPDVNKKLDFIKGVPLTQSVVLTSKINFTTVDSDAVMVEADADAVNTYNSENGTDYTLLAQEYYSVETGQLDEENMLYTIPVKFTCHEMPDDKAYLLPLKIKSNLYNISQREPIYVMVQLNILKMWVVKSGEVVVTNTGKGMIGVEMNAPIAEAQPLDFEVDNSKVEEYNSANATSYLTVDPSKVEVFASEVPAGENSANVSYSIDMKDMEYDGEDKYLVPLILSREGLYPGTEVEKDLIYVSPNKSLEIPYIKTVWGEEKSDRVTKGEIFHSNLRPSKSDSKQKYAINYNERWADGLIYFNIKDETVSGYPERRILSDFSDRPYDRPDGYDKIVDNGSYLDTETGILHFDLAVMDTKYAEQGGFPIQIDLAPAN